LKFAIARAASSGATFAAGTGTGVGRLLLRQVDAAVDSPWWKVSFAPKLVGERPHRFVLDTGGDPQAAIAPGMRLRDQLLEQDAADALAPR